MTVELGPNDRTFRVEGGTPQTIMGMRIVQDAALPEGHFAVVQSGVQEALYELHRTLAHFAGEIVEAFNATLDEYPEMAALITEVQHQADERGVTLHAYVEEWLSEEEASHADLTEGPLPTLGEEPGVDSRAIFPVNLEACWRCQTRIDREDDLGLCESCKTELRDL